MGEIIVPNSSNMQENIRRNIASSQSKVKQQDECWGAVGGSFDGRFIPIQSPWNQYSTNPNPDAAGPVSDLQFNLPTPYRIFFISNRANGSGNDSIYLHLIQLRLQYTAGGTLPAGFPLGTEPILSLNGSQSTSRSTPFVRFKNPVSQIYLTLNTEGGSQYDLCLCATNEENFPINLGYLL